jgi:hypothetical protein
MPAYQHVQIDNNNNHHTSPAHPKRAGLNNASPPNAKLTEYFNLFFNLQHLELLLTEQQN